MLITIIFLSAISVCLETLPEFRQHHTNEDIKTVLANINGSKVEYLLYKCYPLPILEYIEYTSLIILSLEILARFLVSPKKKQFFMFIMNIIGVVSLAPSWVLFIINLTIGHSQDIKAKYSDELFVAYKVVNALRMFNVLYLFRMTKHYHALHILLLSLKESQRELILLVALILVAVGLYGAMIYMAEFLNGTFDNIMIGYWWAVVSLCYIR